MAALRKHTLFQDPAYTVTMRPLKYLPQPAVLLSGLTALSLYSVPVFAQKTTTDTADDAAKTTASDDGKDAAETTSKASKDEATSTAEDATTTEAAKTTTSEAAKTTEESTTSEETTTEATSTEEVTSETAAASTTDITTSISAATTTTTGTGTDTGPTDLPTLTRNPAIPSYPAPTVPPTNNAPFMQHSSAPDGTVFIAVGAILGAFGLGVLLWRAIVGFLLHRSVERAARAQHEENAKAGFPAPRAPFYSDHPSNRSLPAAGGAGAGAGGAAAAAAAGRGVRRTNRGPTPSGNPSQSNLFFSPTAATNNNAAGANRSSAFLPSGFYAAGTSSPGGGPTHDHSISLTNLRPDSYYANASRHTLNPSPPETPPFPPRRDISNSSLNLNRPPSQRAPSAFLEDLLADDPSSLPPPHMPPHNRQSSYGNSGSPGPQNRF